MKGFGNRAGAVAAGALCAVAAPAAIALGGFEAGSYSGSTERGEPIGFRATPERVRGLGAVIYADCDDGTRQRITIVRGRTRIFRDRFSLVLAGDEDLDVAVTGRMRRARAAGWIRASLKPGITVCEVEIPWRASRDA